MIKNKKRELIHLDPRTKLYLLLIGNIGVFFAPSLFFEITLAYLIVLMGVLLGLYKFSIKMAVIYTAILILQIFSTNYLGGTIGVMFVSFAMFIRKIFPCAMLGGILILTTRVNEFMTAMHKIHISKKVVIPLAIMIRYFPMIGEDWRYIKAAMMMRDVSPSLIGFFKSPSLTIECIYVPMMMSASKIADELAAASITRGIENPKPRTCLQEIHFTPIDVLGALIFTVYIFGGMILC
ncbi:energy-coupling factor transporter transmembrane protein EcfT [Clostridium sporogenes]|uniref:energy-coupling factor transporter transmembrane component T n=1 Tax=unclassified Clostridium TaxID=2614128 RepID=UPI0013D2F617|nr:energy-coupling factor transporter transmembrane protein EcfT [Clostridium sporogenes]NFS25365.1 energy-coupling factor transporter transmembrane protein EcfT [Clostridium sporogenes]